MPTVVINSIITPVFNRSDLTTGFINRTRGYLSDNFSELIIVDNASNDNTWDIVKFYRNYDNLIVYVKNDNNLGFGCGNNIGVKVANRDTKNLIFISNDVIVKGDFIRIIWDELKDDEIIGPRLIKLNSGWNTYKESGIIPYIEGFCMAMTKKTFDKLDGWWEDLWIDYEDIEICYHASIMGVGLRQVALPVEHHLGGSFGNLPKPRIEYTLESQRKFMDKYGLTK